MESILPSLALVLAALGGSLLLAHHRRRRRLALALARARERWGSVDFLGPG